MATMSDQTFDVALHCPQCWAPIPSEVHLRFEHEGPCAPGMPRPLVQMNFAAELDPAPLIDHIERVHSG